MMDQYNARASNRATLKVLVENLTLAKTITGHYEHDQAKTFAKGIKRQLATIMNLADPGNGMKNLLEESKNPTNQICSNDLLTGVKVLASAKLIAAELAAANPNQNPSTPPTITKLSEANEEADMLNTISQVIIGAKEGTTEGIAAIVGSNVLDAVLQTADGANTKGIDDYQLHEVITAILDGADRPTTKDVHEKFLEVMPHNFDF